MGKPNAQASEALDQSEEITDELEKGTTLLDGQFTIEGFLNAGGFGITYLARDSLDRTVVVKECFPSTLCRRNNQSVQPRSRANLKDLRAIIERFAQEARSLAKVSHPNIVAVHQVFEDNGTAYMAMDFVRGRDLLDIISSDDTQLTKSQVRRILEKLLGAISHVHQNDMLHRDISPDNILLRDDGEPVLIDFGAAKEQVNDPKKPLSALRVVKEGYSPQEFYIAGSEQNPSCDLYSIAASFYHIVTGSPPPDSQKRLAAIAVDDDDPYVPCTTLNTGYDETFCAAIDKAMSVMAKQRIQSAEEWLELIAEDPEPVEAPAPVVEEVIDTEKVEPRRPAIDAETKADRPGRPQSQTSMMPLLVGSTALAAILGAGFVFLSNDISSEESPTAQITGTAPAPQPAPAPEEVAAAPTPAPVAPATAAPTATEPAGVEPNAVATAPTDLNEPSETVAAVTPAPETPAPEAVAPPAQTVPEDNADVVIPPNPVEPVAPAEPSGIQSTDPGLEVVVTNDPTPAPAPSAPTAQLEVAVGNVMHGRTLALPFAADPNNPGVIGSLETGAPSWLETGMRITSVNGTPITSIDQIPGIVGTNSNGDAVDLTLGIASTGATGVAERSLTVGYNVQTLLLNGMAFEAQLENGVWVTRILQVPAEGSEFAPGDIIVSSLGPDRLIDGPNTLRTLFVESIADGKSGLSFALNRDGQMWVKTLALPSL